MLIKITYALAHAAARDAGNRSMRKAGRAAWSVDDYNAACAEFERLYGSDAMPGDVQRGLCA